MSSDQKMGFNATWSMAVGGMVGGGIFSVLGVVIEIAGRWTWLSFVIGAALAACAASSYALLAEKFGEGGGAFAFLRDVHHEEFAGSISWVATIGYTLTVAVYAFTFGHYFGHVLELGPWFPRVAAVVLIALITMVNLVGVGSAAIVEIVTVWGKVFVLVALGVWGLSAGNPEMLTASGSERGIVDAVIGAASVFMAYEGFQLLSYDYEDVENPERTVPLAMLSAIGSVVVIYVLVTFGSIMLVGPDAIIEHREIALARAGQEALGSAGLWIVTIAALFSTASAINATLFAVGRLVERIAEDDEMPRFFDHENSHGIPDRAIIVLSAAAAGLAAVGSLGQLVEAASLGFLLTFAVVSALAAFEVKRRRWVSVVGAVGSVAAIGVLAWKLAQEKPLSLGAFAVLLLIATVGRHLLMDRGGSSEEEEAS